jgi:hypothetical protein
MVLVDVVADVEISLVTRKFERETIPKMEQIDDQVKEVAEMKYVMDYGSWRMLLLLLLLVEKVRAKRF